MSNIFNFDNIQLLVAIVVATVLSITFHEMAHGYAAYFMGDNTAKIYGRLSLNPLKHIDWIGALCLAVFKFGWAKPVPINPANFKHKKAGLIIVSLAGPVTNFLLAFIFVMLYYSTYSVAFFSTPIIRYIIIHTIYLNLGLGIFNLMPIPPLDGSKILACFLKPGAAYKYLSFERYGTFVLFLCLAVRPLNKVFTLILGTLQSGILNLFESIANYIVF